MKSRLFAVAALASALLASCGAPKTPAASVNTQTTAPAASTELSSQVINGDISRGRPYQVAILVNGYQNCGGTLIASDWVLTAAHCVTRNMSIRAGSNNASSGGQVVRVSRAITHSRYRNVVDGYDIAVLKLERPVTHANAGTLRVPSMNTFNSTIRDGTSLLLSGWGMTIGGRPNSNSESLREAILPLIYDDVCAEALDQGWLAAGTICGGVNRRGQTGCHGDSGGPFAGRNHVFGIVSWGRANVCNGPTAFTSVAHYADWIRQQTGVIPD